jgi:hypothetical protein
MLEAVDLSKRYDSQTALDRLSRSVIDRFEQQLARQQQMIDRLRFCHRPF